MCSFVKEYLVAFVDCLISEPRKRVCYPSYKFITVEIVCSNEVMESKAFLHKERTYLTKDSCSLLQEGKVTTLENSNLDLRRLNCCEPLRGEKVRIIIEHVLKISCHVLILVLPSDVTRPEAKVHRVNAKHVSDYLLNRVLFNVFEVPVRPFVETNLLSFEFIFYLLYKRTDFESVYRHMCGK